MTATPTDSPSTDWNGAAPSAVALSGRAIDLVAQRVAPQLVHERHHQRRPLGDDADAAGEAVDAHADLAGGTTCTGGRNQSSTRDADQRGAAELAPAARAAEDLDAAEHDGGAGGAEEDVAA